MKRVQHVYFRHERKQLPVYQIETDEDAARIEKEMVQGEAMVVMEVTQFGFLADVTYEVIKNGRETFALQTITPGGEMKRQKSTKKGVKRA